MSEPMTTCRAAALPAGPGTGGAGPYAAPAGCRSDRFWVGVFAMTAINAAGLLSGLVIQLTAIRHLPGGEIGFFAVLILAGAGLQSFLAGGIPYSLRRTVSVTPGALPDALYWVVDRHLPVCLLAAAGLAAFAGVSALWFGVAAGWIAAVSVGAECLFRAGLIDPVLYALNGTRKYLRQGVIASTYLTIRLVFCFALLRAGYGLSGATLGLALAALLGALLAVAAIWSFVSTTTSPRCKEGFHSPAIPKAGMCYELAQFLLVCGHLWLVNALAGDSTFIGGYATCYLLGRGALAGGLVIAGANYSTLAETFARGDAVRARKVVERGQRLLIFAFVPALTIVFAHGDFLLRISCGESYQGLGIAFGLLFFGFQTLAYVHYLGEVLGAAGRSHERVGTILMVAALNLGLTLLLAGNGHTTVIPIVVPVSAAFGAVVAILFVNQLLGSLGLGRVLMKALFAVSPLLLACSCADEASAAVLFGTTCTGVLFYIALLWVFVKLHDFWRPPCPALGVAFSDMSLK